MLVESGYISHSLQTILYHFFLLLTFLLLISYLFGSRDLRILPFLTRFIQIKYYYY
jgi:hypothetical protein